ncbi:hypothetical protein A3B42_03225 [Candidatus Daviesbacteria bacterium RIFCSPLOWO2_01_FULL_38_10]|nr:MAG: hypothetical protein US80_C0001G0024 [Candidatus Daviesbacteria bacterium GW2011_GWA2_38_17]OGE27250.1 MAG: hypothetical protein A3D02_03020 [Candidatus Daviesbacteria bacterium RIFCSPHIGHO2_02_FULL_39_41]OGE38791.1 MAG: hypothetical protein A3B42_03225 [Candidatus Daviesbacteria bacterium RIFCSPLOWO2_01_FULL_38_10]OGE44976.1 MAG: hypothetical protein A3E67_02330 [Candidatus Daviesbacteria bacterium RIFCSPHIGHO2_12_FULL_38_25]OGE68449.1 MAG: hypothetical protein A3H81_05840 [Candidatus 
MIMTAESRGARTIEHDGFAVDVYTGDSYVENLDSLRGIAINFATIVWGEAAAKEMMERAMKVLDRRKESEIPSVMLFRTRTEDEKIGISLQRLFHIRTSTGDIPLLYHVFRAFEEQYRGLHLGRYSVQQALIIHQEARWYGHRTSNPVAAYSVRESGIFVPGRLHPWDGLYDIDPLAQEIMAGLFMRVRLNGRAVDWRTGVSRDDYLEPNRAYVSRPDHGPTMEFRRRMKDFGMRLTQRDSQYVVGELK